jgi:hypothetical protein
MGGAAGTPTVAGYAELLQAAAWVATAAGALLAAVQLRRQARQARATFLLELFRQWQTMIKPRTAFAAFRIACEKDLLTLHAKLSDTERLSKLREVAREKLGRMEEDPTQTDEYLNLLELVGFFDHVGLMVRRGYLPFKDVDGLLHGPIIVVDIHCRGHTDDLKKRSGVPPGLYQDFAYLADRAARAD